MKINLTVSEPSLLMKAFSSKQVLLLDRFNNPFAVVLSKEDFEQSLLDYCLKNEYSEYYNECEKSEDGPSGFFKDYHELKINITISDINNPEAPEEILEFVRVDEIKVLPGDDTLYWNSFANTKEDFFTKVRSITGSNSCFYIKLL